MRIARKLGIFKRNAALYNRKCIPRFFFAQREIAFVILQRTFCNFNWEVLEAELGRLTLYTLSYPLSIRELSIFNSRAAIFTRLANDLRPVGRARIH